MTRPAPRVYVDANPIIYALEGTRDEPEVDERCRRLLDAIRRGSLVGVTSELTLAEVLVNPSRQGRFDRKRAYLALLNARRPLFEMRPITRRVLVESVAYRVNVHPQKPGPNEIKRDFLPDAIHVVTAIEASASHFVGSDKRLRLPQGMTRLDPRTAELDTFLAAL